MYKDQGQSRQAKVLREQLSAKGLDVTHAQCLEILARVNGHRTLHVAHAKTRELAVNELAEAQAQAAMFTDLGTYQGRFDALLADLQRIATLPDILQAGQLVTDIFKGAKPVVLEAAYEEVPKYKLATCYDRLVDRLRSAALRKAQESDAHEQSLFRGRVRDWQDEEGALEPGETRPTYDASIKRNGSQFYIDITPAGSTPDSAAGKPQLGLFVEVNNGVPCVHITNDIYGDQVLTVFAFSAGLYLRPDSELLAICMGVPTVGTDLEAHHQWETRPPFGPRSGRYNAFIESSNAD